MKNNIMILVKSSKGEKKKTLRTIGFHKYIGDVIY